MMKSEKNGCVARVVDIYSAENLSRREAQGFNRLYQSSIWVR